MQPYFFPYAGYFQLISSVDRFVIYDNIKYTKKGWINRNRILLNGTDAAFSLPLQKGSDQLNIVERGSNYGWPIVSNGDNYDGTPIPDHPTRPEFNAPELFWNPVISPAGLIFYDANLFPQWRGNAFIGGLSARALVRVEINGTTAREAQRLNLNQRIREVEQGPDGAIWVLEDGSAGRLLRLTPR